MKNIFFGFLLLITFVINASSNEIISEIENNWNDIDSMSGTFKQLDSDGNYSAGKFYFLKPFQSKFDYDNKPENIITNKSLLRIVDKDGYQLESYSIGNNIIKKLLSTNLDIEKEFDVSSVGIDENAYTFLFRPKNKNKDVRAKLFFDINTFDLKKWEIYDDFDNRTVLEFTKIKKNIFISQNLFVVNYR